MKLSLPDDQAGSRPGSRPTSFASPKDVGEKRRPRRCRPAARGAHAAGTEIGKRRKLASLRQPTLLYPISAPATWRHQRGSTSKADSKATAMAAVAARNGICGRTRRQMTAIIVPWNQTTASHQITFDRPRPAGKATTPANTSPPSNTQSPPARTAASVE
jgi:hypothetical protein